MTDTLSAKSAEAQLGWYQDELGWLCRPHEGGPAVPGRPGAEPVSGPTTGHLAGTISEPDPGPIHLDLVLGGPRRTGALDLPALIGVAALERIGRRPAAVGPVLDGLGRLSFLVDLGEVSLLDTSPLEFWFRAGIDVRLRKQGALPLPAPGWHGPQAMVWAVPPVPRQGALPPAELLLGFLDRAVRDAYPTLWEVVHRNSPSGI